MTPGPWHLGKRAGNPAVYGKGGAEVAEILHVTNDDWRGNARLIAAAPALLSHLRMLVNGIAQGAEIPRDGAAINAALELLANVERGEA